MWQDRTGHCEVRLDIDVEAALSALAAQRPVFHSERDFQHALAWQIQLGHPEAQIRLEPRPRRGIHLDLLIRLGERGTAIELKYLVAALHTTANGELFDLPQQSANDISRHDVIKDITRVEALLADGYADNGQVLVLSNDRSYWQQGTRTDTIDAAFRVHEGRVLTGNLSWAARASHGTTATRDTLLRLAGRYTCRWQDYSQVALTNGRVAQLRYLLVDVGPGAGSSAAIGSVGSERAVQREPSATVPSSRSAVPPTPGTARFEILACARKLAERSADGSFTLLQILAEMRQAGSRYTESTILRTCASSAARRVHKFSLGCDRASSEGRKVLAHRVEPHYLYSFIEEWWGEELGPGLFQRITKAPIEHILEFESDWPSLESLNFAHLPERPAGSLRPIFSNRQLFGRTSDQEVEDALRALLLCPTVVVDSLVLDPFDWLDRGWRSEITSREDVDDWQDEMRALLPQRLEVMRRVRPAIESGLLLPTNLHAASTDREAGRAFFETERRIHDELRSMGPGVWNDEDDDRDWPLRAQVARVTAQPVSVARLGKGTLLSYSPFESKVYAHLYALPMADGRIGRLGKLGNLAWPSLSADVPLLIKLRESDESYAKLREALMSALEDISVLPDARYSAAEATAIVADTLRRNLEPVRKATERSAALSALREGSSRLTISAAGLAAGAAAGATAGLLPGLATGIVTASSGAAAKLFADVRKRRQDKLVWDFVMELTSGMT